MLFNLLEMYNALGEVLSYHMVHGVFLIFHVFISVVSDQASTSYHDNLLQVMNLIGDVRGKVAVMMDDMIDTAGKFSLVSYSRHNSWIGHLTLRQLSHDFIPSSQLSSWVDANLHVVGWLLVKDLLCHTY